MQPDSPHPCLSLLRPCPTLLLVACSTARVEWGGKLRMPGERGDRCLKFFEGNLNPSSFVSTLSDSGVLGLRVILSQ